MVCSSSFFVLAKEKEAKRKASPELRRQLAVGSRQSRENDDQEFIRQDFIKGLRLNSELILNSLCFDGRRCPGESTDSSGDDKPGKTAASFAGGYTAQASGHLVLPPD